MKDRRLYTELNSLTPNTYRAERECLSSETHMLEASVHLCGCCKRKLPLSDFYVLARTRRPDSYCKACRRQASNRSYRDGVRRDTRRVRRTVITEVTDREERLRLIRQALAEVQRRMAERKRRISEQEYNAC